jgi:hypothetical protein
MDQFDFRGTPQAKRGLDLSQFIHSQEVSDALATGTTNKQMEIDALLARAKMNEEAAGARNAATNETQMAIHKANNDTQQLLHLVPKETVAAYNKTAGTNYPEMDLPAQTFGGLIQADKQAATDAARERIAAASNERIAGTQAATEALRIRALQQGEEREQRRWEQGNTRLDQNQARLDAAEVEKRRLESRSDVLSQIQGVFNTRENKQGLPTAFDPTPGLIENPTETLQLGEQIGAAGGLPKGAPVLPAKPFPSPGIGHLWSNTPAYQAEKATYDTNAAQWKENIKAPPTTGSGGASMNKGVLKDTLDPLSPPSPIPAATQPVPTPTPSAMGGFPSKVGAQPALTAPGPSAGGPPSSQSPGPDYRLQQTDKGAKSWFNPKTGDRQLISGAQ